MLSRLSMSSASLARSTVRGMATKAAPAWTTTLNSSLKDSDPVLHGFMEDVSTPNTEDSLIEFDNIQSRTHFLFDTHCIIPVRSIL